MNKVARQQIILQEMRTLFLKTGCTANELLDYVPLNRNVIEEEMSDMCSKGILDLIHQTIDGPHYAICRPVKVTPVTTIVGSASVDLPIFQGIL